MTPERLQAICDEAWDGMRVGGHFMPEDVLELLNYIDLLHEDLRITRAERDAEKKKRAQASKAHARDERWWHAVVIHLRSEMKDTK